MQRKHLYATKLLKALRIEKGFTQEEMADLMMVILDRNVSHSTYQKWEQGTNPVKLKDAVKISRELGARIKELWVSK